MIKTKFSLKHVQALIFLFCLFAFMSVFSRQAAAQENTGEDINIHNRTGHEVLVFMFQDNQVHLDESGGVQFANLKNGESAVAHVPNCVFSFLLVDHEDIWHAEFSDCHNTDVTFTPETGHAKKGGQ